MQFVKDSLLTQVTQELTNLIFLWAIHETTLTTTRQNPGWFSEVNQTWNLRFTKLRYGFLLEINSHI